MERNLGFRPKSKVDLERQLQNTQRSLGDTPEHSFIPPSVVQEDMLRMPVSEIKTKFRRRYDMYVQLLRQEIRATGN
ncbi:MAG: hypothetical protein A2233_00770 [Candidatus Kerfeldbacteria bacterium RIFOXYA2_FULL_38_24]|uniref:Uncharacterized protein n=1 Tax=Candidatus Kerfeldbacteria bacterium RIFOXYB2_FULL_38_14 TaxID=1798547 RepID=A0A1G2BIN1_9BACT|nr:MAG: hypothetical protein A2233_00770 [Candidatus Kerfeldbacteria bacterium RIFOXYA2_FULL_38_24]OGY88087.1 MAG: hypothetical protein A2319_01500 [Candidatus Kerfeldbacteria bacterium RIFOXYB2_FULL_38_14]OGY88445.1 MAG: hypothetical protein A2458_02375 [Candidatus Kerfeldbacteria bacterium RIFOXYC2_FULL_38_9]